MKGNAARHDGIVAPSNEVNQSLIWSLLLVPTQMLDMASTTQQHLHPARPVFRLDFAQRLEFAQMVCVAQRMLDARHREVRLPVVMHHDAAHTAQHVATIGADAVVREPSRGRDMQPLQRFDDTKSGLVKMLDRGGED